MCPSRIVRKSITIPVEIYEKLLTFKNENEIDSHFFTRIFNLFLERSRVAEVDRVGISKRTFNKLIEHFPKDLLKELVQSLEHSLKTTFKKEVNELDVERELVPYLKRIMVDIDNIFTGLSFNLLEGHKEFQLFFTHSSTENYVDFWADYLKIVFEVRGYAIVEQEMKKGFAYLHFKKTS